MNTQRLSIGTLQIYVEDGVPRFKDRQGVRTLESVREELHEWKRFLEDWLEKVEPPPALHKLTPEELSLALMQMAHEWRHLGFSNERIIVALRSLKDLGGEIPAEEAKNLIEDVISSL